MRQRKWYPILISTLERKACVTRDILVRIISQEWGAVRTTSIEKKGGIITVAYGESQEPLK